jgi:hypothetical protein
VMPGSLAFVTVATASAARVVARAGHGVFCRRSVQGEPKT